MLDVFNSIAHLLKISNVSADNMLFKLHYKITTAILLCFSITITMKQLLGDPITCFTDATKNDDFNKAVASYCWVASTYTVYENSVGDAALMKGFRPRPTIAPGVGQLTNKDSTKVHRYYQWVGIALFAQALMFYAPRFIWYNWEDGKIKMLSKDLMSSVLDEDTQATQRKNLIRYFMGHRGYHNVYFFRFVLCEIFNFVNVIVQIILTDILLGHEFTTYGTQMLKFDKKDPTTRIHPMDRIFPKLTKCQFSNYGPGGNIIPHDTICVLSLNRFNENVYIFLWFWFIIVASISALGLIYRVIIVLSLKARWVLLFRRAVWSINDKQRIRDLVSQSHVGDWFVLHQLGKNIDKLAFNEFMRDISENIEKYNRRLARI